MTTAVSMDRFINLHRQQRGSMTSFTFLEEGQLSTTGVHRVRSKIIPRQRRALLPDRFPNEYLMY